MRFASAKSPLSPLDYRNRLRFLVFIPQDADFAILFEAGNFYFTKVLNALFAQFRL
jgi:hypothetical protein